MVGRTTVAPEGRRKPSWIAKLIFVLIAALTIVVIWTFARSIDLGRDDLSADHKMQVVPPPPIDPQAP